ncbi:phage integrase [Rhodobacteraceae bacterium KLH11]|nr:phage integrase [Rhodobacteraceae bacterium KLH11]
MTEERTTPLRERMIEDMRIQGLGDKSQQSHIRAVKDFAAFLGRSPDTATTEELRAYQLHMTDAGVTPSVYNARITALRFFFSMTCGREEMKRYMQFRTQPRKRHVNWRSNTLMRNGILSRNPRSIVSSRLRTWSRLRPMW